MAKNRMNEAEDTAVAVEEIPESQPELIPEIKTVAVPEDFFTKLLATMAEMANSNTRALGRVIEEIRKPVHDPIKEAQQKRAKETQEAGQRAYWQSLQNRAVNCSHLREDSSSAIAWAEQSDTYADYPDLCKALNVVGANQMAHLRRGHCQHCQTLFSPRREECVSDEVHKRYNEMIRIPTGRGSNSVTYVG